MAGVQQEDVNRFTKEKVLVVEGKDEAHLFASFLRHLGRRDEFDIVVAHGKNNFHNKFPEIVNRFGGFDKVRVIGIIRDAEWETGQGSAENTFISIIGTLRQANVNLPYPGNMGDFSSPNDGIPKVGVFILPNNSDPGMLEDLCLSSVAEDPGMECVDIFFDCASNLTPGPENPAKAKAQAFLATREEIFHQVGLGAQNGQWNFDSDAFQQLKDFIAQM